MGDIFGMVADRVSRIGFMREFRVINRNSAARIESKDLEAVGESFVPEHVYETIRHLQRFSHMRVRSSD